MTDERQNERIGVCAATGFRAGVAAADIRGESGSVQPDVALVASDLPCHVAGVFTRNLVSAAPVALCRAAIRGPEVRAVVINSGNANACTGPQGVHDAQQMCTVAANALGIDIAEVLVASTGVIGRPLPMDRVAQGIRAAADNLAVTQGDRAAVAIMTTDTVPKTASRVADLGDGRRCTVGGMVKGAGMIHPDMATLIGVLTTDAPVAREALQAMLTRCADATFNCVTVDGDTSTNDTVLLLANGAVGGPAISVADRAAAALETAIEAVCHDLAEQLVADAEGATKHFLVTVQGARSVAEARLAARAVAGSTLVKAAIHGGDPNWGRILAAVGRSGARVDPEFCRVSINALTVFEEGAPTSVDLVDVRALLAQRRIDITIVLEQGPAAARAWGCDLTAEYVRINAEYTT